MDATGLPAAGNTINSVQTAAELRRQIHANKTRDREALGEQVASPTSRFLKSRWSTALFTGLATFLLLYAANPLFVQQPVVNGRITSTPSLRRVFSWSILVALIVALGPYLYEKFLAK